MCKYSTYEIANIAINSDGTHRVSLPPTLLPSHAWLELRNMYAISASVVGRHQCCLDVCDLSVWTIYWTLQAWLCTCGRLWTRSLSRTIWESRCGPSRQSATLMGSTARSRCVRTTILLFRCDEVYVAESVSPTWFAFSVLVALLPKPCTPMVCLAMCEPLMLHPFASGAAEHCPKSWLQRFQLSLESKFASSS